MTPGDKYIIYSADLKQISLLVLEVDKLVL
jgi:hypothetical protein